MTPAYYHQVRLPGRVGVAIDHVGRISINVIVCVGCVATQKEYPQKISINI